MLANWRRSIDERGLSELKRSQHQYELLDFILDDLMPWHKEKGGYDFSLLEVNRYIELLFLLFSSIFFPKGIKQNSRIYKRDLDYQHRIT